MRTFQICKLQKMRIWPFQIVFLIFGMSKLNFETPSKNKNTTLKIWNYKSVGILRVNPCHAARRGVRRNGCGTRFCRVERVGFRWVEANVEGDVLCREVVLRCVVTACLVLDVQRWRNTRVVVGGDVWGGARVVLINN